MTTRKQESPLSKVLELYRDLLKDQAEQTLAEVGVAELVRQGVLSSGKAARLLGLDRWEFAELLARYNVPSVDLSLDELQEEEERLRMLRSA